MGYLVFGCMACAFTPRAAFMVVVVVVVVRRCGHPSFSRQGIPFKTKSILGGTRT